MKPRAAILCQLLTVSLWLLSGAPRSLSAAVMPLPPDKLLALMPVAPEGWTLKQSNAANAYEGWPECSAFRLMEGPAYPSDHPDYKSGGTARRDPQENADPFAPGPALLLIRLTDTGLFPQKLGRFQNFTIGNERVMIQNMPAVQFITADRQRTIICVNQRFLLSVEGRRMPGKLYQEFLKRLNLAALAAIPNDGPATFSRPLIITQIDELKPANNGSYKLYWATPEELGGGE